MGRRFDYLRLKHGLGLTEPSLRRPVIRPSTIRYRSKVADATARACMLLDPQAYRHPSSLQPYWDEPVLPSRYDLRVAGGRQAARRRAEHHEFDLCKKMAFSNEFLLGLRVSGALGTRTGDPYRIYVHKHIAEALVGDLQQLGVPFTAAPMSRGYVRVSKCPFLQWQSSCQGKATPSIVAGILAGARIIRSTCEAWLELPNNPLATQYLDEFLIPKQVTSDGKKVRASPYFAALLSPYMPEHLAARVMNIRKPVAGCPLMPAVYFDWLGRRPNFQTIPATTALPYGCAYGTFFHHGFQKDSLTIRGRNELGIVNVAGELARLSCDWIDAYFVLRGNGEVTHDQIRDRLKEKYFPPVPPPVQPSS